MLWKSIINKNSWIFHGEELAESVDMLENPARGWYGIYTFPVQEKINPKELRWSLRKGETLALVLLDIYEYRSMPLDRNALDNIRSILSFFMQQKRDVILRPVYDREGRGHECEPDTFELVMEHLSQISEILRDTEHSVFVFQGMLVGNWGEMHGSRYLSLENMLQMWKCMREYVGDDIYLAVRTPAQWRTLRKEQEFQQKEFLNLALFDDGILGSLTHLGTFGTMTKEAAGWSQPWMRQEELKFIDQITEDTPCGGEVTFSIAEEKEELCKTDFVVNELKKMHLTYLDSTYDMNVLNQWKEVQWAGSGTWQGHSLYEYIGGHLGYRLLVRDIKMRVLWFGKVEFTIEIENVGFGRMFQKVELILIIENENDREEISVPMDMREIHSGCTCQGKIVTKATEGKLFLKLQRIADKCSIQFANKNSTDSLCLGCMCYSRKL